MRQRHKRGGGHDSYLEKKAEDDRDEAEGGVPALKVTFAHGALMKIFGHKADQDEIRR